MKIITDIFTIWFILSGLLLLVPLCLAHIRTHTAKLRNRSCAAMLESPPCEILIPIKGPILDGGVTLQTLLEQDHPAYYVTFIVESEDDPANETLDSLLTCFNHARKLVSLLSDSCCQKNRNLIEGIENLRPETEIVVFCDSSNEAHSDWLSRMTQPIANGKNEVVTTFRAFDPQPETLGGLCQALYGAALLAMMVLLPFPRPWGGATAIRRDVLEKLDVKSEWARTVVDDLVLGNILDKAGVRVYLDVTNLLRSPLRNQSITNFLNYLDRQVLFPKFTNPVIWILSMLSHIDLPLSFLCAGTISAILLPAGLVSVKLGAVALLYLGTVLVVAYLLRALHPFPISLANWLIAILPCTFMAVFVFIRSIFRNYIVWNGRRYITGPKGIVLDVIKDG